jgi:hypothetical protein
MYIAIDFDGTCVTHEYPEVGKDIGAVPVLKRLVENGHKLILHTMRGEPKKGEDRNTIQEAVEWFKKNDIPLFGINHNKMQTYWTTSRKVYANLYIDDAALGAPLIINSALSDRPFIDWRRVEQILTQMGLI